MNSHAMELEGLKRCLAAVKTKLPVLALITDRHAGIRKYIETTEKNINHYYDSWHLVKCKHRANLFYS